MLVFRDYKQHIIYIIGFSVFVFLNVAIYTYFIHFQKKQEKLMLTGYLDSVGNLLSHDLVVATQNSLHDKKFFLFKNFSSTKIKNNTLNTKLNDIKIKPYILYIKSSVKEFTFDLQELRENLNRIFPNFVDYSIIINDCLIASGANYNHLFDIEKNYEINENILLTIKVGINHNSNFYLLGQKKLHHQILIIVIVSFLIYLSYLYHHIIIQRKIKKRFDTLEYELQEQSKTNNVLLNNKKISHLLNKLFIKKATEMYVKQALGATSSNEKIIIEPPDNYLFPMCLHDTSTEQIDIISLMKYLEEYFSCYFMTIAIRMNTTINIVSINCAMEAFYQIIFSLIFNLMEFMNQQSENSKLMQISFSEKKVIIKYDSFPLDEARMIALSEIIMLENKDIFLLSCDKIFKSLKNHSFQYTIFSSIEGNIIEISYPIEIISTKKYRERNIESVFVN